MSDADPDKEEFQIEGPDEEGFVWLRSSDSRHKLGPVDQVAEAMSQFLASIDVAERSRT